MPVGTIYTWVVLPLLIFAARIVDVSIGTVRIIFLSRHEKVLVPLLGFFEILIWLLAIRQIFVHLENPLCYVAYAAGFATGNYVGMIIENRIALGLEIVRVISARDLTEAYQRLRSEGFEPITVDGQSLHGPVKVSFFTVPRRKSKRLLRILSDYDPNASVSIEDVRYAGNELVPVSHARRKFLSNLFQWTRKRK